MSDRDVAARIDAVRRSLAAAQPSSESAHGNTSAAIVDQAPGIGVPARESASCADPLNEFDDDLSSRDGFSNFSNFANFADWSNFDNFADWSNFNNFVNFADWIMT